MNSSFRGNQDLHAASILMIYCERGDVMRNNHAWLSGERLDQANADRGDAVPTWVVHPGEADSASWTGDCRDGGPKDTRRPVRCAAPPPPASSSATGAPCSAWLSIDVCPAMSPWGSAAATAHGQYMISKGNIRRKAVLKMTGVQPGYRNQLQEPAADRSEQGACWSIRHNQTQLSTSQHFTSTLPTCIPTLPDAPPNPARHVCRHPQPASEVQFSRHLDSSGPRKAGWQ